MRRNCFNFLAGLSLVLFLAAAWLWLRSYTGEVILVGSRPGQLVLIGLDAPRRQAHASWETHATAPFLSNLVSPYRMSAMGPIRTPSERNVLGFWFVHGSMGLIEYPGANPSRNREDRLYCPFWILGVPYWLITPLAAILPAAWLWRRRRAASRHGSNACVRCGYDLRATPDRCPECGAVPGTAEAVARPPVGAGRVGG